jgi:hypothetical protein
MAKLTFSTEAMGKGLPVFNIVREAYASLTRHYRTLTVIGAPLILFGAVAHEIIQPFGHRGIDNLSKAFAWFLVNVVSMYFNVVLAVTWIRAVALQPSRPEILFGEFGRLWRFFKYGLLYTLVVWGPVFFVMIRLHVISDDRSMRAVDTMLTHPWFTLGTALGTFFISTLVIARVGLLFPAITLDYASNLRIAWQQSSGIFWQMMVIIALVDLPFELVSAGLSFLKAYAGDATYVIVSLVSNISDSAGFLILLSAVSLIYAWRINKLVLPNTLSEQSADKLG